MFGATCILRVSEPLVGQTLHQLEYHLDIVLLRIIPDKPYDCVFFVLRSLRFPSDWEGKEICAFVYSEQNGLLFFKLY